MNKPKRKPNSQTKKVRLSKSRIADGLVCEKKAYLSIHSKELKTKLTKTQQARLDAGTVVGRRARELFPGGHLVDFPPWKIEEAKADTEKVIASGENTIYEAAVGDSDFHCFVDILHRDSSNQNWNVYEVKSGSDPKSVYIDDLAIQCWILNKAKVKWDKAYLIFLNRDCRYPDLSNLFVIEDITDAVKEILPKLTNNIKRILSTVNGPETPEIGIGRYCEAPYECGFKAHCWKVVPEYSVFDLPRGWSLFDKGRLKIEDIEEDDLTEMQKIPYRAITEDYFYINQEGIEKAISSWKFPIYHLDFETVYPAIPRYDETGPYTQTPYQFSLHIQNDPTSEPKHFEYLHPDSSDPRRPLAEKLCKWIPEGAETVMAFNSNFEAVVLKMLANLFPDLSKKLLSITDKLVDPHPVVKANVYRKEFRGSFSIKAVAPALLGKERDYGNLEVSDGNLAQVVFEEMISEEPNSERSKVLREQLLRYCAQDTLVMVELVKWLYRHCLSTRN